MASSGMYYSTLRVHKTGFLGTLATRAVERESPQCSHDPMASFDLTSVLCNYLYFKAVILEAWHEHQEQQHHLGTCYKWTLSASTLDLQNQRLWGGAGGDKWCAWRSPLGDSNAHLSLRTTTWKCTKPFQINFLSGSSWKLWISFFFPLYIWG